MDLIVWNMPYVPYCIEIQKRIALTSGVGEENAS